MLTDLQKKTGAAIVNVFETGRVLGDYGAIATIAGDTGHLSYGRSQVTLASGNLYHLMQTYCNTTGALLAAQLSNYLQRFRQPDLTLDTDMECRRLLAQAGSDSVMRAVQDSFFDLNYWTPAVTSAAAMGLSGALGASVVYDSHVQGAWNIVRDRTIAQFGDPAAIGENNWINRYVSVRRAWLANNANPALHPTVYRMDSFLALIEQGRFDLALPITVRGITIDANTLNGVMAPRTLHLATPPLTGDDVRAVQQALVQSGKTVVVDGVFGPSTDAAVRLFQQQRGLAVDGVVDTKLRALLSL
jgi:chitosanase